MAAADQELLVRIAADTRSLRRELDRAANASRATSARMEQDFKRTGDRLGGLAAVASKAKAAFAGLLAGVSVGALVQGIGRITQQMDRLVNTADRLGVTVEALQELRFAAAEVGVETQTLDMAMQRFIRRLGEAQAGGGELKDTLAQYGIALRDANGQARNADAVLNDLANAIKSAGSEQERLRIAFKAFDSEGAALVTLLRQGGEGLDMFRAKARDLGVVVKDSVARELAASRREIERFTEFLSTTATLAFADFLEDMRALTGILPVSAGALEKELNSVTEKIARLYKKLGDARSGGNFFGPNQAEIEAIEDDISALNTKRREIEAALSAAQSLSELRGAVSERSGSPPPASSSSSTRTRIPKRGQGVNSLTTGRADDETRLFFQVYADEHTEKVRKAREAAKQARLEWNKHAAAARAANNELESFGRTADDVAANVAGAGVRALRGMEDALVGLASGTVTAKDAFRSMALSIVQDLQRIIIQKTITGPLGDFLGGMLNQAFTTNATKWDGSALKPIPGQFTGGINSGAPGFRAAGGGVRAGSPYIVGENRPELFVPDTAGRIMSTLPRGGAPAGGGSTTNIMLDLRGVHGERSIESAVMRGIRRAAPGLIEASVQRVTGEAGASRDFRRKLGVN